MLKGNVVVQAAGREQKLQGDHALAVGGSGERVTFEASGPTHFVLLSWPPSVSRSSLRPFHPDQPTQIDGTVARYEAGDMGTLE